jgi:hypothetical protein
MLQPIPRQFDVKWSIARLRDGKLQYEEKPQTQPRDRREHDLDAKICSRYH